jgi:hypothetical protein
MWGITMILIIIAGLFADIFDLGFGKAQEEECSEECKNYFNI